jgi:hypothetical protein
LEDYIASIFRVVATCSCRFLARGFFYPEDGGDVFLLHGATSQKTAFFIVSSNY